MIKHKKILLFLVFLFIVLITVFTTIRFRTVKYFTQVYTYPEWKLHQPNMLRFAFLEFMNQKSFLPCELELTLIDSEGNKQKLAKGNLPAELYQKAFIIKDLKSGHARLMGRVYYDDKLVDNFTLKVKIIESYKKKKLHLAPIEITEIDTDFSKDDKITYFPRFIPKQMGNFDLHQEKDIQIQLFTSPKDIVFSEKSDIFLLFTLPDYTPIDLQGKINVKEFHSKPKNHNIKTDANGLVHFKGRIYRSFGHIYLDSPLLKKKIPFQTSDAKTAILPNKYLYALNEKIDLNIKAYKKIDALFLNSFIGDSWLSSEHINIQRNKDNKHSIQPPKDYQGFMEFRVHKGYSYLKDASFRVVYIGSKESLKQELLTLNIPFITKTIKEQTDDENFYTLVMAQLAKHPLGIHKVFDSYHAQQEKLDQDREKYQTILWNLLLLVSIFIVGFLFFGSLKSINDSQKNIEFQFQQKGGKIYLYIFTAVLIGFMSLILWVLKIV